MKASLFGIILGASALAPACGKKEPVPTTGGVPVTGAANPSAPAATPDALGGGAAKSEPAADKAAIAKVKADKAVADKAAADKAAAEKAEEALPPLTAERLEALVMAMATCKLEGHAIDQGCPEALALTKELGRKDALKGLGDSTRALGMKLLGSESPILRIKATEFLAVRSGGSKEANKEGNEALLAAYGKEKIKEVRLAFLRAFAAYASLEEKAAKVLYSAVADDDTDVRAQAVYALTQPNNKRLDGAIDRLIKVVKSDPDPKLRQVACERAGQLGDEKLLPVIAELTKPTADAELAESCMRGLVSMWADTERFENASERAYRLTLRLLERMPRTAEMPSWVAISNLEKLDVLDQKPATWSQADARAIPSWKARAPWYKPSELRPSLRAIINDPMSSEQAAAHSVTALAALGLAKGELDALQKGIAGTPRMVADGPVAIAFARALGHRKLEKSGQPGARIKLAPDAPPGMKLKVVETPPVPKP